MTIHLIGICGTAMATLAAMLKRKGFDVRGSDHDVYPPMSEFLAAERIPAFTGYRAEQITSDLDDVPGWVAARAWRPRSDRLRWGDRAQFRRSGLELPDGAGARLRHRGRR